MNRRECLRLLGGLGVGLALPALALESATATEVDAVWLKLQSNHWDNLDNHPRIALLRSQVQGLPVAAEYKNNLLHSITLYRDQFLERPEYEDGSGWDDLEAIQQVTLSDMNERWLNEMVQRAAQEASL